MKAAILALLIGTSVLVGCGEKKVMIQSESRVVVIAPSDSLNVCPQLVTLPDPETLTNQQVNEVIEKLFRYNRICRINMTAIFDYVRKAKEIHGV